MLDEVELKWCDCESNERIHAHIVYERLFFFIYLLLVSKNCLVEVANEWRGGGRRCVCGKKKQRHLFIW